MDPGKYLYLPKPQPEKRRSREVMVAHEARSVRTCLGLPTTMLTFLTLIVRFSRTLVESVEPVDDVVVTRLQYLRIRKCRDIFIKRPT